MKKWVSNFRTALQLVAAGLGAALLPQLALAVLSGTHFRDVPPTEGGRWGVSAVLLPDAETSAGLAAFRYNGRQPVRQRRPRHGAGVLTAAAVRRPVLHDPTA